MSDETSIRVGRPPLISEEEVTARMERRRAFGHPRRCRKGGTHCPVWEKPGLLACLKCGEERRA